MIVVSPNIALAPSPYANSLFLPVMGWRNVVNVAGLAAETEDADHPVSNLANVSTAVYWQGADASEQTVTITPGLSPTDYIGLARHNLGTAQIPFIIDALPAVGEDRVVLAEQILADDRPLIVRYTRSVYTDIRITFGEGLAPPRLAILYAGLLTSIPASPAPGFTPLPYGIVEDVVEGKSESGEFLGRLVLGQSRESNVTFQGVDEAWWRDEMAVFQRLGRNKPFFFAWAPVEFPSETGLAWLRNVVPPRFDVDWAEFTLQMGGIA